MIYIDTFILIILLLWILITGYLLGMLVVVLYLKHAIKIKAHINLAFGYRIIGRLQKKINNKWVNTTEDMSKFDWEN